MMVEHQVTRDFEKALCRYTGAPICIAVDNCCNAIFLCLRYIASQTVHSGQVVYIPRHTYIGVPYAIRAAGFTPMPSELPQPDGYLEGEYNLYNTPVWDSALRFTSGMYRPMQMQCLSFTGPHKHLKTQKGGAILLDNPASETWIRRAAFSGRRYVSYHNDTFEIPEGYNQYMPSMLAALGLQMLQGIQLHNPDLRLPYPDWSIHTAFNAKR